MTHLTLFNWRDQEHFVKPWRPVPLDHTAWPPDYRAVNAWRYQRLLELRRDPSLIYSAKQYYSTRPAEFIMHWLDTYDPRRTSSKWIPFVFFAKQSDVIEFLHALRHEQESGLIEKCRDAGATWLACGYSVWSFLFIPHDAIGWGSRKAALVDKLGDPDSIFEKMRLMIRRMPREFQPSGWDESKHANYMKIINPENGASITGEAGDNIGRGGRKSIYMKDEAAHYERPDKIEAALGDNTNVQIDISSVNGTGNPFHRRRIAGKEWQRGEKIEPGFTRILTIDWRDHPAKDQEWYDKRRAKYEREGMLHLFAQEVDRDYSAAVTNTIIPKEYIMSAIDAHIVLGWPDPGNAWSAGLDVADGGIDRNGFVKRQGLICRHAEEWGERDAGVTTRRAVSQLVELPSCSVYYDSIGIGAAVKSEYNRLRDVSPTMFQRLKFIGWNAGAAVQEPFFRVIPNDESSVMNGDFFHNIKAQAWWSVRTRFYKTHQAVKEGIKYPVDELISLDKRMPSLYQLIEELAQPVKKTSAASMKMIVDKQPDGMKSPNLADAFVMCYFPITELGNAPVIG